MTEPLSGVVQVPRKCPVSSGAEIGLLSLRLTISQGRSYIRILFARTWVPHREDNSLGGVPLFNFVIRNLRECCDRPSLRLKYKLDPELRVQSPVASPSKQMRSGDGLILLLTQWVYSCQQTQDENITSNSKFYCWFVIEKSVQA